MSSSAHEEAPGIRRLQPSSDALSSSDFDAESSDEPIGRRFEAVAARFPGKVAVKFRDESLTYEELNALADCAAARILDLSGPANEPVGALFGGGVDPVVALMACLKAGKAYVPLDASYPPNRLEYMLADTGAKVIITDHAHLPLAGDVAGERRLINVDDLRRGAPVARPDIDVSPDSLASIIYTSGSTGNPKGVMHEQRQLIHWAAKYRRMTGLTDADRICHFFSFAFAATLKINLATLLHGASVFPGTLDNLDRIGDLFAGERATVVNVSPSVLSHFLNLVKPGQAFPHLRFFYISGETFQKAEAARFRRTFPADVALHNVIASTEAGAVRRFPVDDPDKLDGDTVPVGYPVGDAEVLILDDDLKSVPPGETGQVAVRSRFLSSGYWHKADVTAKVFLSDPEGGARRIYLTGDLGRIGADGCLFHLGRKDAQLKIRSYRVEASEVEAALRSHPGVNLAAVVVREDRPGDQRLVAYVIPTAQGAPSGTELRRFLRPKLPDYMVPSVYVTLDTMPLNPNGKVDRKALPVPERRRPELENEYVAPRTPIEEGLAAIWAAVLDLDRVGVNDNFFELGGHSLIATQALARMLDLYKVEMPLSTLFEAPTVAGAASLITERLAAAISESDMERMLAQLEATGQDAAQQVVGD